MGPVHGPSTDLGGLDQVEGHRQSRYPGAGGVLVTLVRSRTIANVDSMGVGGLDVQPSSAMWCPFKRPTFFMGKVLIG